MLRTIFVLGIIAVGAYLSLYGAFYILLFYLWNAYFRPEVWVWTDLILKLRVSFILGVLLAFGALFNIQRIKWTPRLLLVALFFMQSSVALVTSEHYDWSLPYWIEFSKVLLVSLSITLLVTDLKRYRIALVVIAYSLGAEAAKQGWAQLFLNPGGQNNNPHPVLGDNNGVGMGMMMLVPFFVALAQTASTKWEKYLHRFFIIGLVYRGISTYSRGAFLTAAAVGLLSFWRSPKKIRALVAVTALALIVTVAMPDAFWERMRTITAPAEERDASQRGRLYFWNIALKMASARPFTGVGFNAFRASYGSYDLSAGAYGEERAVHSAWFGVLAEMGYPGLIIFVLLFVSTLLACGRLRRTDQARAGPAGAALKAYGTALQTSLIAYGVGVTFLNGQYNEMYWHMIGLSIALESLRAAAIVREPEDSRASAPLGSPSVDLAPAPLRQ